MINKIDKNNTNKERTVIQSESSVIIIHHTKESLDKMNEAINKGLIALGFPPLSK